MPTIFDNIDARLLPELQSSLKEAYRADFCVGYFNLRGWDHLAEIVDQWPGGGDACCRILIGMQALPQDELRAALSLTGPDGMMDNKRATALRKRMAAEFREQLTIGAPTNAAEAALRHLSRQLRAGQVVVRLHADYPLHAKLYLLYRHDRKTPVIGYLGSSNLTFAGLQHQGELNVDVLEQDAAAKLQQWFTDRWDDLRSMDISTELADIIDASWASETILPPYYIYLKMAYHLSQEARAGLSEFQIPRDFGKQLFPFQEAAVQIAAHHVQKRDGVLIGDVVGLGKTLMATALARIFQDDFSWDTLIICPKNLTQMWEDYKWRYHLTAQVLPISQVDEQQMKELRRFRLVLIDESHNLRNREGKRYRAIQDYITHNESKCILLTATPYNKTYLDLSAQLRLFIPEDRDLGIRPERLLNDMSETEFLQKHQCGVRTLAAFEQSDYPDDWRELMRLFMVRRTRSFIQDNYTHDDPERGQKYITFADGTRSYFPQRVPRTVGFAVTDGDAADPYARLYGADVVAAINDLALPRYGLGHYIAAKAKTTQTEDGIIKGLSRARDRLRGFCRTNLFKRLESGGPAFLQSIERHILRNFVFLHALENGLDIPLGSQESELLDPRLTDRDADAPVPLFGPEDENGNEAGGDAPLALPDEVAFRQRAATIYQMYAGQYRSRFKWLRAALFTKELRAHLLHDARELLAVLGRCGAWEADRDAKLAALVRLLTEQHPQEKVLIFTQFADTVTYLTAQLRARGVTHLAGITGEAAEPTRMAWRFSPVSNRKDIAPEDAVRVLVTTDVLSEGQNLQDCHIVVNYDLPWAIIRLIQRAGRVDRIGQQADAITCYTFLPAEGVEQIIRLRARVRQRLHQNAEVVGTDEAFFEDDMSDQAILNIYNEKAHILDGTDDNDIDLTSLAYQIWKNATAANPKLATIIPALPAVAFATRAHDPTALSPEGVLLYLRTADGNDTLARIDTGGQIVTQSLTAILDAAACNIDTPGLPRDPRHHELVREGVAQLVRDDRPVGGQLGRPGGARFRVHTRLSEYARSLRGTLWESPELERALDVIWRFPLRATAVDTLTRQLRSGIPNDRLAELVLALQDEDRLCMIATETEQHEPQIICSLGLFAHHQEGS